MSDGLNRRERKKIHSRKAILDAAVELFSEKGFRETSIADIMNQADLGIGTFYNYFSSKEEILKNLLGEIVADLRNFMQSIEIEKQSSAEIMMEIVLRAAEVVDKNRYVLPLFLRAAEKGETHEHGHMLPPGMSFKTIFDKLLKNGQERGEFRTDIPAEVVTEMFHSVFQAASFSSLPIPFMENVHYKTRLILDGIKISNKTNC